MAQWPRRLHGRGLPRTREDVDARALPRARRAVRVRGARARRQPRALHAGPRRRRSGLAADLRAASTPPPPACAWPARPGCPPSAPRGCASAWGSCCTAAAGSSTTSATTAWRPCRRGAIRCGSAPISASTRAWSCSAASASRAAAWGCGSTACSAASPWAPSPPPPPCRPRSRTSTPPGSAAVTGAAYPLADIALLTFLATMFAGASWRPSYSGLALVAGLLVLVGVDTTYAIDSAHGGWFAGGTYDPRVGPGHAPPRGRRLAALAPRAGAWPARGAA